MVPFDAAAVGWLVSIASDSFIVRWLAVIAASYLPYVLVLIGIVSILKAPQVRARWMYAIQGLLALILSRGILRTGIAFFYDRPRPFIALGFEPLISYAANASFPSGHAAFLFALGAFLWTFNRRVGWWLLALAFVNGIARVAVGLHYPTDILGGALIGIGSVYVVYLLTKQRKHIQETPALQSETTENRPL